MPYIPEDKLQEVRDAAAIDEVVGQYVRLERKGRNLVGLCPFHPETKPSFTVSPDKGIFYCFGCQTGGNVISFVMQYHKLSFTEAVVELARRYGINLTFRDLGPEDGRRAKKRELLYEVHREALAFYRASLTGKEGRAARDYLAQRGLTPEVIKSYQLGYAPDDWDGLRKHLQSRGLPLEVAAEAGLLVPRPSGGYYDRFRERVIFPIFDRQERVVAFGGRLIGEGEPKYLNSPESPLYSKGRLLYGLPQAREALRQEDLALVVEGYLDLLALRVKGVRPVLASLGTALTRDQVRLLRSLVSRVVLVFDGDPAGVKAMRRAFPLLAQEGLPVRVIPLPPGMDPDDYVKARGPDLFRAPWERAQPWFIFLLEGLVSDFGLDVEGRVKITSELRPFFQAFSDPVERGLWLRYTAERLGVPEVDLRRSLASYSEAEDSKRGSLGVTISLEKGLVRWVLQHPTAVSPEELARWAEELEHPDWSYLLKLIAAQRLQGEKVEISSLLDRVEGEQRKQELCALILEEGEWTEASPEAVAEDWRRAFKRRRLEQWRQHLKAQLAQEPECLELLAQKQEIDRQLEALK
jgi:DNA primase